MNLSTGSCAFSTHIQAYPCRCTSTHWDIPDIFISPDTALWIQKAEHVIQADTKWFGEGKVWICNNLLKCYKRVLFNLLEQLGSCVIDPGIRVYSCPHKDKNSKQTHKCNAQMRERFV